MNNTLTFLKNAIVAYMTCEDVGERRRMVPAIAMLLRLSPEELGKVNSSLDSEEGSLGEALMDTLTSPLSLLGMRGDSGTSSSRRSVLSPPSRGILGSLF